MTRPTTLAELRSSGWRSKTVKQEIHDNFVARLQAVEDLYPGIVGYDDTVIPERKGPGQKPADAADGDAAR
jgi:magnesium chelatase subunit I